MKRKCLEKEAVRSQTVQNLFELGVAKSGFARVSEELGAVVAVYSPFRWCMASWKHGTSSFLA